ncbi:ABC transporter substrate-binding protein [Limnohabitans sp. MMS-10A-160]|uniref:TRAP transporter substrate-binding protein n=1 Tax=unclassified Limnohabitans TaxID=2626134 RepID=UPI000D3CF86B|nr:MULTISPECIES: TRAP transporter substrate-binding protein [unclassified Limnohabitans]PUE15866.1 ABC transporter substrate-binding protein [Limnohabitans sp. MMS-10A-192]PUE23894.1 ABC transporter substrate-binding protein [Limnohabitans sp. MMS-10A-160]
MKKTLISMAALALTSIAGVAQAQTVLTVSSWLPPTHTASMAQKEWCDLLTENTKGRIKCNMLPRGVSPAPGTYDAIKNGLADLSYTVHGYTPGRFVMTQMTELPFLGNSAETISVALSRVSGKNPEFAAEHQGVKVLTLFSHGPGIVFNTKRPIAKTDDLSGLKFRVGGGMVNDISKTLGMNATLKPAPDSYELLSSGVMDGTLFPAESTESFRIDKIIKHATTFPGGLYNTSFVFMMNQAKYDKLSAEDKKAVDAISGETAARIFGRGWDKVDRRAFALMQVNGVQVTKADAKFVADIKSKTAPLEQGWIKAAEAKGLKNPAKVLSEFRAEIAKLEK